MNITVYCGSTMGNDPIYAKAAKELGEWICARGHSMVYGGGNIGLMGLIADTVLSGGGAVTGVIPEFLLEAEKGHEGLHTLEIVSSMSERKNRMMELGDAFIAMPGGTGTLEEISEAVSLQKLGILNKPCIFYNINGFYEPLRRMFHDMQAAGFSTAEDIRRIRFVSGTQDLEKIF